jgi:ATP-dependent Clp protease ATP-binding subunit ClpC
MENKIESSQQVEFQVQINEQILPYRQALLLDSIIKPHQRKILRTTFDLLLVVTIIGFFAGKIPGSTQLEGVFFLLSACWITLLSLEFFYNSSYFSSVSTASSPRISYLLASLFNDALDRDAIRIALTSDTGKWIFFRAGIGQSAVYSFLDNRHKIITLRESGKTLASDTLSGFFSKLIDSDEELRQFILISGSAVEDIVGAADWLEHREEEIIAQEHWWSRDALSKIPGLAKDWTYGQTYSLDRFSRDLFLLPETASAELDSREEASDERALEDTLARPRTANALLVGDVNSAMGIVSVLARNILEGSAPPEIEHCRLLALDTIALIDSSKEKTAFERLLITVLNEAAHAGNIILLFEHLPEFLQSARAIGSDVVQILDSYLALSGSSATRNLRFIALAERDEFHQSIESNQTFSGHFEKILLKEVSRDALIHLLEREVERYELRPNFWKFSRASRTSRGGLFFTYGALKELAGGIEQYWSGDEGSEKVRNLLAEIVERIGSVDGRSSELSSGGSISKSARKLGRKKSITVVGRAEALALLQQKTGIPLGEIQSGERDKLLQLESRLHERIVGQDEAVSAIANAMRRARSGINNPSRPMGSFLFLGPTGVGKTETTKALAQTFFGNENQILRIDMSEYSGGDALVRLTGSFEGRQAGILTQMLRDKQYGVLLLDEFEKASRAVHDLFLQILDEGFFSDMNGRRVSARNTIIIATSNAGSDLIFQAIENVAATESLSVILEKKKSEIVDSIIAKGIFRPELLNRFDGIILFHPLEREHLEQVARLQLEQFAKRLKQKGITLTITPELVAYVVSAGSDPKFGARAMNRAIQENVEQAVARKIIAGSVKSGETISLSNADMLG